MSERLFGRIELEPVEIASIPVDFDWKTEGWFAGGLHPILRLEDKTEWISKPVKDSGCWNIPPRISISYQIVPFVFQDEAAMQATGAHIIIPEGGFSNRVMIADRDLRIRTRIISGAGWVNGKSPLGGQFQQWLGSETGNRVFEFSMNWIYQFVAPVRFGPMIMELVEMPEFKPGCEIVLE